jgi:glycyl-tRNA synthetase beta chain
LTKAVQWSKSDLTTDLVREFTELQGVMGGLYAKYEGAAEDVWRAIYDQYKPQSLDDRSAATRAGAVLSITDKLDTVLSCFSVGIIPTGSEDPLGLRRAMQGVIKTLLDHHLPFSLEKVAGAPTPELKQFYEDRIRFILSQRGFAYDEINAVVNVGSDDAADALDRIEAIRKIRSSPDFEAISLAFKRIKNILRQAGRTGEGDAGVGDRGDGGVGSSSRTSEQEPTPPSLEPAEADLFALLNDAKPKIDKLARSGKYLKILETMAASRPVIDHFFDKIMVMHEDQEVRKRRIALLRNLFAAFSRVADISEIVVQG